MLCSEFCEDDDSLSSSSAAVSGVDFCVLFTDLFGIESGVDCAIVRGQDCGVMFESSTKSFSDETGTSPAASVTIFAPG